MTPLQKIAMGVVFLVLRPLFGAEQVPGPYGPVPVGYDGVPNPVGWLLVLWGVLSLPPGFVRRRELLLAGVLATAVSVPLWLPEVQRVLLDQPELAWAASLPQGAALVLVCLALLEAPRQQPAQVSPLPPGRTYPEFGLRTALVALAAALAAPPLIFGAGLEVLALPADAAANLSLIYLVWTCFRLHRFVPVGSEADVAQEFGEAAP